MTGLPDEFCTHEHRTIHGRGWDYHNGYKKAELSQKLLSTHDIHD